MQGKPPMFGRRGFGMMKTALVIGIVAVMLVCGPAAAQPQTATPTPTSTPAAASTLKVILLGTAGGPTIQPERLGISTLVVAGSESLLFDAGRGLTFALARLSIPATTITKVFLTHLHSDHIVSLPELYLFPWASQGRKVPLRVWGPDGTRAMMEHLREAFSFDIHVRRDVDEKFSPDGIGVEPTDIREGVVYDAAGVTVTAFLVDHGPVAPAFGYRVDYAGHSVVLSGDTKPTENLVKFARGADVLIHEVGRSKNDPAFIGPPDELLPGNTGTTRQQAKTIAEHHTDAAEAAGVFQRASPKLVVFSHANSSPTETLATVKRTYPGRVEFGSDLMTIEIGSDITIKPFERPR
jgi:ribonuclease Z